MDTLLADLRFALRSLRKTPGFTLAALLTLALGIGANTAIFSLVNGALLRSLPYARPESLVLLWGNVQRTAVERRGASFPDYIDWRDQSHSFVGMAAYWSGMATLVEGDQPERVHSEVVSASYFPLLGVEPALGRLFREGEDATGAPLVAMLSDTLWTRRFGRDPTIIGKVVRLSGRPFTIVGVLPPGFKGLSDNVEVWQTPAIEDADYFKERGSRGMPVLARLKADVSVAQAQADLTLVAKNLERAYPQTNEKRSVEVAPLTSEMLGDIQPALLAALAAVGLVLLIACANVASLLLARAESRSHEMAIRTALGASRRRIYRQLATESLLLTLTAAGCGLLLAHWITGLLLAVSPIRLPSFVDASLDGRVLLVTLLVAITIGVLLGFAPAWQIAGGGVQDVLKESSTRTTGGRHRFRHLIVIGEIALAVMLLAGAGLLIRSLLAIAAIDPGFRTDSLLTLRVGLPELPPAPASQPSGGAAGPAAGPGASTPVEAESTNLAALAVLDRVRRLPGVFNAGAGSDIPLGGEGNAMFYTAQGQPPTTAVNVPRAYRHRVTPGFIETLGLKRIAGQDFVDADMQANSRRVIVSEAVVQRFWPGERGIGKQLKVGRADSESPWLTIAGVVGESKYRGLQDNWTPDPDIYFPFVPRVRNFALLIQTTVPPDSLIGAVRQAVRSVEPAATVSNVSSMEGRLREQMARPRFVSWLVGAFAGLALLLAAIGIYGVLAQTVARRTPEIGLRMALGATRGDILRLVLGQGLWLIGLGLVAGIAGALALMRMIQTLLFGVSHTDPLTFGGVAVLLVLVALLATWLPAQRATRVDPLVALRHD
jgi:ABC-type antimicrobial peptide transport system permease subunit